jgi:hypothetical protein
MRENCCSISGRPPVTLLIGASSLMQHFVLSLLPPIMAAFCLSRSAPIHRR